LPTSLNRGSEAITSAAAASGVVIGKATDADGAGVLGEGCVEGAPLGAAAPEAHAPRSVRANKAKRSSEVRGLFMAPRRP
jgi:hypothetical protein